MRAQPCGIEMLAALGHDLMQQKNIRIAFKNADQSEFVASTRGSHHIGLVDLIAKKWNSLLECAPIDPKAYGKALRRIDGIAYSCLPKLKIVASGEVFGLVKSEHTSTFGGLLNVKDEVEDSEEDLSALLPSPEDALRDTSDMDQRLFLILLSHAQSPSATVVASTSTLVMSATAMMVAPTVTGTLLGDSPGIENEGTACCPIMVRCQLDPDRCRVLMLPLGVLPAGGYCYHCARSRNQ